MKKNYVIKVILLILIFDLVSMSNFKKKIFAVPIVESSYEKERERKSNHKTVFITFDDGPSINNTRNIIKILNEYNIKATFFIIGNKGEEYSEIVKELHKSGMCIASHTYTHEYERIFKSVDDYRNDLEKCDEFIENLVGEKPVPYIRIPGGTHNSSSGKSNMNNIINYLKDNNINYVGWNVCSNDALGRNIPSYKLFSNVKNQTEKVETRTNILVLLMHDSYYKKTTVEVLPQILDYYVSKGYEFKTFKDITKQEHNQMIKEKLINKEIKEKISK